MKPNHIAIIPDGNRRWAKSNALKPWQGHQAGMKGFIPLLKVALEHDIYALSAWMASIDNLQKRPQKEIDVLYKVFEELFDLLDSTPEVMEHEVRVVALGDWKSFQPKSLVDKIEAIQEKTKHHTKHRLTLFDGYDGITEMTRAVQSIVDQSRSNELEITPELIKKNLFTHDLPPVDLVIRTGGEPHWSGGFMMWDIANAHFYFSDTLWPDFSDQEFRAAIEDFKERGRRFGT